MRRAFAAALSPQEKIGIRVHKESKNNGVYAMVSTKKREV